LSQISSKHQQQAAPAAAVRAGSAAAKPQHAAPPQPAKGAGPRSPASAYCVQMGGAILNTPKGKNTLCRFPDGKEMDPWDLFWRDNPLN
jgi:putative hemolysin